MIVSVCTLGRNADIQRCPKTFVWEESISWEFILRTLDYSILNPRYTENTTLELVLVEIKPSGYALRNIETLELNLGKYERAH